MVQNTSNLQEVVSFIYHFRDESGIGLLCLMERYINMVGSQFLKGLNYK
jgi:hypothetical protein